MKRLRDQHGTAIDPLRDRRLVAAVGRRIAVASGGLGESFTTPDRLEAPVVHLFARRARLFEKAGIRRMRGAESGVCHDKTSELFMRDHQRYRHVFGWGAQLAVEKSCPSAHLTRRTKDHKSHCYRRRLLADTRRTGGGSSPGT